MLEVDPRRRITAGDALAHGYFSAEPFACAPERLRLLDGDSHEFFLRIQQGNKLLASGKRSCAKVHKRDGEIVKARKRPLVRDDNSLAPSTKESIW